ncbi:bifunctional nicotinamidase/pyrazinamidase [Chelativorans sp. ZYF759]|uniref:bifunctional nicotinamidase/pyrazinamidase n=1 Tax=Chelativorans sp. ZYF759 TaxID=2692213 RepID=UPI00145F2DC8|nr:bifunctional nicotinamidase/pyrazinamidase [Chelativorans sp. ZYF759]NMG38150.1 bifunctional nicotinamidase/pyrazinamidase [Chelativorans sp. ZYF759]
MAASALVVIDVQNDFCPGGALAVAGGDEILPIVNRLVGEHEHVVVTQDWHPAGHSSFASQHGGKSPFDNVEMPYGTQTLWPDHCVQGTPGAEFHPALQWEKAELIIRKGFRRSIDSYSAFFENDHATPTGLNGYLVERGIRKLVMVGLATDFCVAFSALDAARLGFAVTVVMEGCRAIDMGGSLGVMTEKMRAAGVTLE